MRPRKKEMYLPAVARRAKGGPTVIRERPLIGTFRNTRLTKQPQQMTFSQTA